MSRGAAAMAFVPAACLPAAAKTQEANNPGGGCGVASWKVQTFVKPRNGMVCSPRPQLQQT